MYSNEAILKLVNELIEDSFPELKRRKIFVFRISNFGKAVAVVVYYHFFSYIIISQYMDLLNRNEAKSILAHELAHLSIIYRMTFKQKVSFLSWFISKKVRAKFERNADLLSIKKGYGKWKISANKKLLRNRTDKEIRKRESYGYLSNEEIKMYMRRVKQI